MEEYIAPAFGFRFIPTDEELIELLLRKSMDLHLPFPSFNPVVEKNIYGDQHPSDVLSDVIDYPYWKSTKDSKDMYIFTKLTKVSSHKSCSTTRIQRTVNGHGTWGGQTGATKIKDSTTGELIGSTKMFSFVDNKINGISQLGRDQYHWIMHEFSLDGNSLKYDLKHSDYVMCKITRTLSKKKRKYQEDPEEKERLRLRSKKQKTRSTMDQEEAADIQQRFQERNYNDEVVQFDSTKDGNDLNGVQQSNDEFWSSFQELINRPADYEDVMLRRHLPLEEDAIFFQQSNNNTNNNSSNNDLSVKSRPVISVQQSEDDDDDGLYEFSATLEDLLLSS